MIYQFSNEPGEIKVFPPMPKTFKEPFFKLLGEWIEITIDLVTPDMLTRFGMSCELIW